ncbi:MAG: hypothetical protein R3C54_15145 [Parvularculaceae bacterium]
MTFGVVNAIEAAGFSGCQILAHGTRASMVIFKHHGCRNFPVEAHRVYRHVCDENYAADIQSMQPLFDLVRKQAMGNCEMAIGEELAS